MLRTIPMSVTPLSQSRDLTREEIVARYRDRIAQASRNKLGKSERDLLVLHFIDRLQSLDSPSAIEALCATEISLLEEGYQQSTVAFDYLPQYRKAIEGAIADGTIPLTEDNSHSYHRRQRVTGIGEERFEHYALTYLKYDEETYAQLDARSKAANRTKQLHLKGVNPDRYLERLEELLLSRYKFAARHRAIAIAGLTGRRLNEVLARGRFALADHPFLLRFEGHSKVAREAYDIVTLIEARRLLPFLDEFRAMEEIQPLLTLSGEGLTLAVNKFDVQVNRECNRYLGDIVPPLAGKKAVSIHNLRGLWGAIAAYFFCPPSAHEYPFLQHYLGHAIDSSATGHYFRYRLVDTLGHYLSERGVKLSSFGELPLPFEDAAIAPEGEFTDKNTEILLEAESMASRPSPAKASDDIDARLAFLPALDTHPLAAKLKPALTRLLQSDRYTQLLAGLMAVTGLTAGDLLKGTVFQPHLTDSFSLLTAPTLGKSFEHRLVLVEADSVLAAIARLRAHPDVQSLLYLSPHEIDRHCLPYVGKTLTYLPYHNLDDMMAVYASLTGTERELPGEVAPKRPPTTTYHLYSDDRPRLDAIATALKLEGSYAQIFRSLLAWVEQQLGKKEELVQEGSLTAIAHQAQTLAWLTEEISTLRQRVAELERERDSLGDQLVREGSSLPHLAELESENRRLSSELERANATLATFRSLLNVPIVPSEDGAGEVGERMGESEEVDGIVSQATTPDKKPLQAPAESPPTPTPRRQGSARERALAIWHSLQDWNRLHPDNTFALTVGLLEATFHVNRGAAKAFVAEFEDEISAYHDSLGVSSLRTHNRGKDPAPLVAHVSSNA